jgi:DNA-binding LacI/PurR family transcriptional regulator
MKPFPNIWRGKNHPTALVAMSDIIAVGAMDVARKAGVRIPEDLSIVGFDDLPLASWVNPPLTTVAQPLRRKGKVAAEMLVKHIGGEQEASHLILRTRLVVSDLACPPPR